MLSALDIHVTGIVQGVGFRPFIYRIAKKNLICGWVANSADGVHIHAEGQDDNLDSFCMSIANDAPPASCVEQIEMDDIPLQNYHDFTIKASENEKLCDVDIVDGATLVSPDLAICKDCIEELFDKGNRRFHYPFINCTNCGPRFTIIKELPYDRQKTSMNEFEMCEVCSNEYSDPVDRRFHAQPDACFDCGPKIQWCEKLDNGMFSDWELGSNVKTSDHIFERAATLLSQGKIIAVKGIGGFHLCCDASNSKAVTNLRNRKQRSNKAFAVMASEIQVIDEVCHVNQAEREILHGTVRPIVLLKTKGSCQNSNLKIEKYVCPEVQSGLFELGVMLPYTPVQHLLLESFNRIYCGGRGCMLVMTSGNIYDNPIAIDDQEALNALGNVADGFLGNTRKILTRYDDSVVRVLNLGGEEAIQYIRRARGYAPAPIKVNVENNNFISNKNIIFASGAEQKNTFSYLRNSNNSKTNAEIFVGQHIGDVENAEVYDNWITAKNRHHEVFRLKPDYFVCDMHPDYLTSKWVRDNIPTKKIIEIQHHYSHIASVIAENQISGPVVGFSFDGTGYGTDGQIWGGDVLIANSSDYERFANFTYMPMPGGVASIKDPMQMAYGILSTYDLLKDDATALFNNEKYKNISTMIENSINTPYTSSLGRIFDAISAILGICPTPTYEGEAACMLESCLQKAIFAGDVMPTITKESFDKRYLIQIIKNTASQNSTAHDTSVLLFDIYNMLKALLEDLNKNISKAVIIKNFHDSVIYCILQTAQLAKQLYGIDTVALSGGCFMNRYLVENTVELLINNGFKVAINRDVPPNDGGVSVGQVFAAANAID